jgi:hypothetical protein
MNNFFMASCFFSATKLLRDSNKNMERLFDGYPVGNIFILSPSVGVKYFWVDLDGKHVFAPTPGVGVVHMWVVCM